MKFFNNQFGWSNSNNAPLFVPSQNKSVQILTNGLDDDGAFNDVKVPLVVTSPAVPVGINVLKFNNGDYAKSDASDPTLTTFSGSMDIYFDSSRAGVREIFCGGAASYLTGRLEKTTSNTILLGATTLSVLASSNTVIQDGWNTLEWFLDASESYIVLNGIRTEGGGSVVGMQAGGYILGTHNGLSLYFTGLMHNVIINNYAVWRMEEGERGVLYDAYQLNGNDLTLFPIIAEDYASMRSTSDGITSYNLTAGFNPEFSRGVNIGGAGQSNLVATPSDGYANLGTLINPQANTLLNMLQEAYAGAVQPISPTSWGFEVTAADQLLTTGYPSVNIAKTGVGATALWEEWNPIDGSLYPTIQTQNEWLISETGRGMDVFIWIQGSDDGEFFHANDYAFNLDRFIKAVRADAGNPNLPVLIAEQPRYGESISRAYECIRSAQRAAAYRMDYVYFVPTFDIWTDPSKFSGAHYDQDGLIPLGRELADAYVSVKLGTWDKGLTLPTTTGLVLDCDFENGVVNDIDNAYIMINDGHDVQYFDEERGNVYYAESTADVLRVADASTIFSSDFTIHFEYYNTEDFGGLARWTPLVGLHNSDAVWQGTQILAVNDITGSRASAMGFDSRTASTDTLEGMASALVRNSWTNIDWTYDSATGTNTVYQNGELLFSTTNPFDPTYGDGFLHFGHGSNTCKVYFDNLKIWDRVLFITDIRGMV